MGSAILRLILWPIVLMPLLAACSKLKLSSYPHTLKPGELMPYLKELTWTNPKCLEDATSRQNIKCESFFDGYIYHYGLKLPVSGIIAYDSKFPEYHWLVQWYHSGTNPDETGVLGQCFTAPRAYGGEFTYCLKPPS